MIKNIISSSPHLYAASTGTPTYVPQGSNNPSHGMLRINGYDMEVFNGSVWQKINLGEAGIGLNTDANDAIDWAIKKMKQEQEWYELASSNDAVRIALENLEQARTQLELTAHLAREYDTKNNN